jgi:hypothetical protein
MKKLPAVLIICIAMISCNNKSKQSVKAHQQMQDSITRAKMAEEKAAADTLSILSAH